jgi:hypothetical protein
MTTDEKLQILSELKSETCLCGKEKKSHANRHRSFCRDCFYELPVDLRRRLYSKWGAGYVAAYVTAREYLNHESELQDQAEAQFCGGI